MRSKYFIAGAVTLVAAIGSVQVAKAGTEATDEETPKDKACKFIGCPGGTQSCADVEAEVGVPGVGTVTVTYYCYEAA
jgi:hypothetical protein